jgi:hypothetical protein
MTDAVAMPRFVRVVLVAVFLTAAACGGGSSSKRTTSTLGSQGANAGPGSKATTAACALITQADATKLFGHAAQSKKADNPSGAESVCVWAADTNPDPNSIDDISYLLQVRVYDGAQYYGEKYMKAPKSISGLGDKAFTNVQGPLVQAQFVKDGKTVTMAYSINAIAADPKPKASDQQDEIVALARTAASRL